MAHVYAARALVPGMLARKSGYLINTASAAGLLASMGSAPYGVTKTAAVALAEHLAIQYGDKRRPRLRAVPAGGGHQHAAHGRRNRGVGRRRDQHRRGRADGDRGDGRRDFLILPHPEVKEYMARKLDRDRWLRGMRRLRDKRGRGSASECAESRAARPVPSPSVRRHRPVDRDRRHPGGRADARLRGFRLGHADGADLRHPVRLGRHGGDRSWRSSWWCRCSSSRRCASHADWQTLTPMSVAACAAMPLGVWLLASVDKGTIVTARLGGHRGVRRADVERLEISRPALDAGRRRRSARCRAR